MGHDATFKNKWCIWLNSIQSSWLGYWHESPKPQNPKKGGFIKYMSL